MPEPYWPKRKGSFALSDAHGNNSVLRITCTRCKKARHYLPSDMKEIFGDIQVDDLVNKMRCDSCGLNGTVEIGCSVPSIAELRSMTIRRLDRIKWVRRVSWREVRGA